ncbi:PspC domain-containing protein [Humibacter sp. RRB41]|uniref:PspC domain-containing protein n=1 Tax=Humibacter sp. RRB41 TaxID=2919946 RepID=UPI001FA9EFB2|nr:PspC domain-containing protein [Humibacter sp. RRB41]
MPEDATQTPRPPEYGSATPGAAPGATPSSAATGSTRFFGWLRGLGIVRQNGWAGGVCGGIAARLGIDPIIVRGIAVVVATLGGPAFLVYAAAWLLLPDASGDIHLERLIKGHFEPATIGIIVLALFSFLPFAQGFWWAGAQFWGGLSWFASVGRALWGLLVIGLIVAFVIWAARSGRITPVSPPASAAPTYPSSPSPSPTTQTSPTDAGGGAAHSASASAAPASTLPDPSTGGGASYVAPPAGQPGADQDAVADWRARQDAWRTEYAAWNAQQADARAIKQQRTAEIRAQAQALAAESERARRERRAANPRTSAAYVGIALGLALVLGGVGSAVVLGSSASDYSIPIGLAIATAVIGGSIVLAGVLRRRSGFLGFVSIVLIVACLVTVLPPRGRDLVLLYTYYQDPSAVSIYQPLGSTRVSFDDAAASGHVDISQGVGSTEIDLVEGLSARVVITQHAGRSSVNADRMDADGNSEVVSPSVATTGDERISTFVIGDGQPTVTIKVDQAVGSVYVAQRESL